MQRKESLADKAFWASVYGAAALSIFIYGPHDLIVNHRSAKRRKRHQETYRRMYA